MKKDEPGVTVIELLHQMGDLLLQYDYAPHGKLLLSYSQSFDLTNREGAKADAGAILGMYGGWGGLVDIILADEHGPNLEDNRRFDSLRSELFKQLKKLS